MRTDAVRRCVIAACTLLVAACGGGGGGGESGGAAQRRDGVVPTSAPTAVQVSIDERRWERARRTLVKLPAWTLVESRWLGGDARTKAVDAAWREAGVPWELDFRVPPGEVEWFGRDAGAAVLAGAVGGIGWIAVRGGSEELAEAEDAAVDAYGGASKAGTHEGTDLHEGEADGDDVWWAAVGDEALVVASSRAALEASIDANADGALESTKRWRDIGADDRATRLVWGRAPGYTTAAIGVSKAGPWLTATSNDTTSPLARIARSTSSAGAAPQPCTRAGGSIDLYPGLPALDWDGVLTASTCAAEGSTTTIVVDPARAARTLPVPTSGTRGELVAAQIEHIDSIRVMVRRSTAGGAATTGVEVRVRLA